MQYPIFISVSEAAKILRMGRTAVYEKIRSGDFTTAKIGRSTRITFSSAIQFALRSLKEGNGNGAIREIFGDARDPNSWVLAEMLASQLCYTRREPAENLGVSSERPQSCDFHTSEAGSPEKNFGGEF